MHRPQSHSDDFVIASRYEVKDPPIGQGGMGVVYKGYDTVTRRFVAIKTIWGSVNSMALSLFEKEWSVLASLSHPNIVDILETGQFEEAGQWKPFFVMPLLPGVTLDNLIKRASQRLTVERTVDILSQACRGLQAAHDQGIVHRDIKPSNIFVMDDDSVKLIDFGVVHLTDMSTMTGMKGTLNYLAPELLDRKPPSVLSDIFALGVVGYETLTRRKPFERPTEDETIEAIRAYIPPPISDINSVVNEPLSRTVHKAMAKQAWHRFSTAREYGDVLKKTLRSEPIEYFDPARIQPRIERVKRAQGEGDYQFAREILTELEAEGHISPEISLLRMQLDQAIKQKTIRQLLESARTRMEEEEYPLALQKIKEVLEIDPENADAMRLKGQVERQRNEKQIDNWYRLVQQHIDNQLFSQARLGLEEILRINPAEAKAHSLLDQVDRQEKEANKIREEKEQLYQSALKSYQCGEVSTALDKLERLLGLTRQSTRIGNPEKDSQYQSLYNQIRSERETFRNGYAEARHQMEDKNFSKALALCSEFLAKNSSDPLFQALKLEVEERERQAWSAAVADVDRRVETEADLARKINILKEAVELYPNEPHFKEALTLIRQRRDLLDSIVSRAKQYEEQSLFNEALGQWDILRNIYPQYPGLDAEVQRLRVKQQEQLLAESKSRWVRRIDQNLETGEYEKAQAAVRDALLEFPGDRELASLEKLAAQALEKKSEAQQHYIEGQKFLNGGDTVQAIASLRKAVELDARDRILRGALLGALLDRAKSCLNDDWRESQTLVNEALKLDGGNPVARSFFAQVQDRERQALVDECVLEARELQAGGDIEGALNKVRQGLLRHPRESRLSQLENTLLKSLAGPVAEDNYPQPPAQRTPGGRNRLSADSRPSAGEGMGVAAAVAPRLQSSSGSDAEIHSQNLGTSQRDGKGSGSRVWKWAAIATIPILMAAAFIVYIVIKRHAPPPLQATLLSANVPNVHFFVDGRPTGSQVLLSPGREYVVEAKRDGYQKESAHVKPPAGQTSATVQFSLNPLLPRLQVISNLQHPAVVLAEQAPRELENGELVFDQVAAGTQKLKIFNGSRQVAEFTVSFEAGQPVRLSTPFEVKNLSVVGAAVLGSRAAIVASENVEGSLTGQERQPIPAEGLNIDIGASGSTLELSNGKTMQLAPSNQPALILLVSEDSQPPAVEVQQIARLKLVLMPDDASIVIDNELPRPASGTYQMKLAPGKHTLLLRRPHYEDSPEVPVTLKPGQTLQLDQKRFSQEQQGTFVFKLSPANSVITYAIDEPNQTPQPHKSIPGETVWLKPGRYNVSAEAPGFTPDRWVYSVTSGTPTEVKQSLKAVVVEQPPAAAPPAPRNAEPFQDQKLWSRDGSWWVWKSSAFGWLSSKHGVFTVTIQRPSRNMFKGPKKVEWTIDNHENGDGIDYFIENNTFHRVAYKSGNPISENKVEFRKHPKDYNLTFDISTQRITISEAGNGKIDEYDRPNAGAALGKIGFKGQINITVQQK